MTISSTTRIAGPFTGNGTASTFPFTFKVFAAADLDVVRLNSSTGVESTLVLNSDYSVTLNGDQNSNPGGSITLLAGALATGFTLVITSDIANLQPTDLTNQGGFYPEVITDSLDRATIQIQQISDIGDRTIKIPITDGSLNMELPTADARANSFLAFDANGLPTAITAGTSGAPTTITRQVFSGTGSQTVFTLASDPGALGNSAQVYIGGVYQQRSTYTIAGTILTFSAAPVAGTDNIEFVNFLTSSIGATSADLVTYTPAGVGAVARSAASKFGDTFNVMDYVQGDWAPNNSAKDFTPTFAAAIAAVAAAGGGVLEFIGKDNYYFLTRPPELTGGVCLEGNRCIIWKKYIETGTGTHAGAEGTNRGVFSLDGNTNNNTFIRNFSIINDGWDGVTSTGNGSAISIVADAGDSNGPGLIWISNIHCTASGTGLSSPADYIWWKSCIYLDGSEMRSAPIGIRGLWIDNCTLFTPATAAIEAYAVEHLYVSNTESNVGRTNCCGVKVDGGLKSGGVGAQTERPMFSNCDFQSVFGYKIGTESSATHSYVQSPIVMGTIGQLELGAQAITPLLVGSQSNTLTVDPSVNYTLITEDGSTLNGVTTINGSLTTTGSTIARTGNATGFRFPTGVTTYGIACAGATDAGISGFTVPAGESIRFTMGSAKSALISLATGDACMIFADYKSATVSLVSNPTGTFTNATGTPSRVSVTKSANNHNLRIYNEFATTQTISVCVFGSTPDNITLGP